MLKRTIFTVFFISALLMIFFNASKFDNSGDKQQKYSMVRIFASSENDIKRMMDAGLLLDHAESKPGHHIDTWLSEEEISMLKISGVPFQVTIDDWMEYYNSFPKMTEAEIDAQMQQAYEKDNITHSIYGSMGGYLTYNEVVAKLDSMRLEYPQFISAKFSIGTTYEGRTMWAVRVTKNPDAPTGRPEVLLNALIHAREPEGMETQVYYMYWLFENYNTDPIARFILNNREIYWVPVYNIDGYVYNQTTNPNGGGMWRKSRKPCSGGIGADLNRNYGIYQFWNSSNGGSSTNCASDTYRGTEPFSEQEVNNMKNFINSRNFKTALNAHTYGNLLLRPWAWSDPNVTPDDNIFQMYSLDLTDTSNYAIGTSSQTLQYYIRGGAYDWDYNDSGHTKIISLLPETGSVSQGFWPQQNLIIPLAQGMLHTNKYITLAAGAFTQPVTNTLSKFSYTQGESGSFKVVFKNKGLTAAQNVKIEWTPSSSLITIPVQVFTRASILSMVNDSVTFSFTVSPSAQSGTLLGTVLTFKLNDTNIVHTEPIYVPVNGTVLIADSAENGISNWNTGQGWGVVTNQFHSGTHSFTDSPSGNYQPGASNSLTLNAVLNVSSYQKLFLTFWHNFRTEARYDFCIVEVSTNNGSSWTALNTYSYNGHNKTDWRHRFYDLTSAANGSTAFKLRFRLTSDGSEQWDGWYIDDIRLMGYTGGIVGISGNILNEPYSYSLGQNYPNPFNPVTKINYTIASDEFVKISVYNVLGELVSVLVNTKQEAGTHAIEFDGTNLASGLYLYKIEAGDFRDVKKMVLVR
jgi:carboxypeptidase T